MEATNAWLTALALLAVGSTVGCSRTPAAMAPGNFASQACVEVSLRRSGARLTASAPDGADRDTLPDALAQFSRACAAGEPSACSALGVMYEVGAATRANPVRASHLYQRACEAGNVGGCMNLGRAYLHGIGVVRRLDRAHELLDRSCKYPHPVACRELGTMYLMGDGVAPSATSAVSYFLTACELGDGAGCMKLGALYEKGIGVEQNIGEALAAYELGCVEGQADACDAVDRVHKRSAELRRTRESIRLLPSEAACLTGDGAACTATGLAYFRGDGVPRNAGTKPDAP